jgi:hypothetical protein
MPDSRKKEETMQSRTWRAVATTVLLGAMVCGTALAQGRGFGRFMRGPASLLQRPEVQTELKLTADQKTKATALTEKLREERQGVFQDLRDASPEERQEIMNKMQAEETKRVNEILEPAQQKRLRQVYLQQQGEAALAQPAVQEELKLTAEQKTKVGEIMRAQDEQRREIFQNSQGDREAAMAKMEALRKSTNEKLAGLLTEDQKSQWKAMLGTTLTLAEPAA